MTDDDVKDMLEQRAAAVQPSADAFERIQAKLAGEVPVTAAARRRPSTTWLAAAAVVVLALVGAVLFLDRDDTTNLATTPPTTAGQFAPFPLVEAVWPSNDPEVLNGISAAWAREESPLSAVRLYLTDRVGEVGLTDDDIAIAVGDEGGTGVVTVTGPVVTEIDLRRLDGDGPWYVQGATSGLLGMGNVTFDGSTVHTSVLPGTDGTLDVTASAVSGVASNAAFGEQDVIAEEQAETSFTVSDDLTDAAQVVVTTVLRNGDVVALDDRLVDGPQSDDTTGTTTSIVAPPASTNEGVWPKHSDDIDDETLSDPVSTAARYLEETVGSTASTVLSDFRRGDTTSGEIEVSGDLTGTILLRELDGRWHVEAVISDLVEAIEGAPGEVRLIAKEDGVLSILALDADGNVVTSMPNGGVVSGQEVLVVPDAPDGTPITVRWKLQTPMDAATDAYTLTAIGDVSLYGGAYAEHAVPPEAIFDEGGLDARETASRYLADRLGGRTVTVSADATIDGDHAEVSWEAGVVELLQVDDYWYVTEAIGDSIQIEGPRRFRLAQAGTVHVTIGTDTFDVRNDTDREGTVVDFDHDVPDEPFVMRAVFVTDSGFVSLAERHVV
jgi:hypothetical protein